MLDFYYSSDKLFSPLLLLLDLPTGLGFGTVYIVSESGVDYTIIQDALNVAVAGDTILVREKVTPYDEELQFPISGDSVNDYFTLMAYEGEKKFILKAIDISLTAETSAKDASYEYKKYTSEVHEHWEKYTILYFNKIKTFMEQESPNPLKEFERFIDNEKEERDSLKNKILFILSSLKAKVKNFLLIGNETYGFAAQHVGQTMALTSIPKMVSFYFDYLELIKKNEKLLSSL